MYLLQHLAVAVDSFARSVESIDVFENDVHIGCGMPYSPSTTDVHNFCNITSEELLPLDVSFTDWLRQLDAGVLRGYTIRADTVSQLQSVVMPFLLNEIAALPLPSAKMLLAMRDAGRLELVNGHATVVAHENGETVVEVDGKEGNTTHRYRMLVDCTGQGSLKLSATNHERLTEDVRPQYKTGGIDVDSTYRVIGEDGQPNDRIYDIAFPHATGVRLYSYGLQACELTPRQLVDHWKVASASKPTTCEIMT